MVRPRFPVVQPPAWHRAYISIGSNIDPANNIRQAINLLREEDSHLSVSAAYETRAVGSDGPNFINMAVGLVTRMDAPQLKKDLLTGIETRLSRVRTSDKNAPRTIDLDIVVFDGKVVDEEIWNRVHLAVPLSDLLPGLLHPTANVPLRQVAERLQQTDPVVPIDIL
jgi:2-amino-4-hydroxy-6-hydroxymethyldihydropteridine diphosphokinase